MAQTFPKHLLHPGPSSEPSVIKKKAARKASSTTSSVVPDHVISKGIIKFGKFTFREGQHEMGLAAYNVTLILPSKLGVLN